MIIIWIYAIIALLTMLFIIIYFDKQTIIVQFHGKEKRGLFWLWFAILLDSILWPIFLKQVLDEYQHVKVCPLCGNDEPFKVIQYGMPMLFCSDENCNCLYGIFSYIMEYLHLPFTGWLYRYEGSYIIALYHYLIGDIKDE
jgi:hypothetical protein